MMRRDQLRSRARLAAASIALVAASSACTTGSGPAPSQLTRDASGFTVTQDVRVGVGVRSDFEAALELLQTQHYERGIERMLEVVEAAPQLASAHINLAIAYRQLERWDEAQASIERAIETSPRHPVAHNEAGMIHRRQGRFEEARASYERALELAEDFHFARRNLAIVCDLFLADVECALEHYERYADAVPEDELVHVWIADLRQRQGLTNEPVPAAPAPR